MIQNINTNIFSYNNNNYISYRIFSLNYIKAKKNKYSRIFFSKINNVMLSCHNNKNNNNHSYYLEIIMMTKMMIIINIIIRSTYKGKYKGQIGYNNNNSNHYHHHNNVITLKIYTVNLKQ